MSVEPGIRERFKRFNALEYSTGIVMRSGLVICVEVRKEFSIKLPSKEPVKETGDLPSHFFILGSVR